MAVRLFIGNLPYKTTSDELRNLFTQAGEVNSADVVMDRFSGRSRGFGFVELTNDGDADGAIEKFNGYELDGRKLVVNVARPREERNSGGNGGTVYQQAPAAQDDQVVEPETEMVDEELSNEGEAGAEAEGEPEAQAQEEETPSEEGEEA